MDTYEAPEAVSFVRFSAGNPRCICDTIFALAKCEGLGLAPLGSDDGWQDTQTSKQFTC